MKVALDTNVCYNNIYFHCTQREQVFPRGIQECDQEHGTKWENKWKLTPNSINTHKQHGEAKWVSNGHKCENK